MTYIMMSITLSVIRGYIALCRQQKARLSLEGDGLFVAFEALWCVVSCCEPLEVHLRPELHATMVEV